MLDYNYVLGTPLPTSFSKYVKNKGSYALRVCSFRIRCFLSKLQGKEPTPYKIDHTSYYTDELGSIGEEFVLWDIPNRRNFVYVLGKMDIEKSWQSWVRNPLYMNTNTTHLYRIHDIETDTLLEGGDPMKKSPDDEDQEYWIELLDASLHVMEEEHEVDIDELTHWYNKQEYLYGKSEW